MARYDKLRKLERNREIVNFRNSNPDLSWDEVAAHFKLSRQRTMELYNRYKTSEAADKAASGGKSNGGEG